MRLRTVRRWRGKKFVCKRELIIVSPYAPSPNVLWFSYETWKAARAALGLALIVLALAACGPKRPTEPPHCPTTPVVVDRVVETRAPLPSDLIEPLQDPTDNAPVILGQTTVGEAITWAEQRRALVARCQADRAALRAIDTRTKDD